MTTIHFTKPSIYKGKIDNIDSQYKVLLDKFMRLYPEHKINTKNTEYKTLFDSNEQQIQKLLGSLDTIGLQMKKDAMSLSNKIKEEDSTIEVFKKEFDSEKTLKQKLQEGNLAGVPREKEFKYFLMNKYLELGYYGISIVGAIYIFYILLKSKSGL
jgi:uncharacterized protein YrzB (UPF0473 family)